MGAVPVVGTTRAKGARVKVRKHDKLGRPYVGTGEIIVSRGMFSAREAEHELQKAVDAHESRGDEVVGVELDTYGPREVPEVESNPRRASGGLGIWGFEGASWLPESPEIRRRQARREQAAA